MRLISMAALAAAFLLPLPALAAFSIFAVSGPGMLPTLVAGTLAPTSQTPLMPSVSTWAPSCLDGTWGTGCNTSTHLCTAPTSGSPSQPCQPPLEFYISSANATASTGNGTTATIQYTSQAGFTFTPGTPAQGSSPTPLLISGATQSNWNTPVVEVTAATFSNSGTNCSSNCVTATTSGTPPFTVGQKIYVGGMSAANYSYTVTGTPTLVSGTWTVTFSATTNPFLVGSLISFSGFNPTTFDVSGALIASGTTVGSCPSNVCTIVATSGSTSATYISGGAAASYYGSYSGQGWPTQNPNGVWTVLGVTGSTVTWSTPSLVTGTYGGLNTLGFNGSIQAPWVVTASTCIGATCSVTFNNPNSCASSCVAESDILGTPGTQIVAGQNDDLIMNWHFGEDVPMSLHNDKVVACAIPKHISPVTAVWMALDGGAWTKITAATDYWGVGKSGLSSSPAVSYCAQFTASSVSDGEHEVRAIGCAEAGYCHILSSAIAIDGTTSGSYFTAHAHGMPDWQQVGITNSFDSDFLNYDWRQYNPTWAISGATTGSGTVAFSFTQPNIYPEYQVGESVEIQGVTTSGNSCTVSGGTTTAQVTTLNLNSGCTLNAGSIVTIAGVSVTGGNAYAWNGTAVLSTGGTSSVTFPNLSTATYVSGGTVTASWNGPCIISAVTTTSITCPTSNDNTTGTTYVSSGSDEIYASGNLYCVVAGNGDAPTPYNPAYQPYASQQTTDSFQLIATLGVVSPYNCRMSAGSTGCSANPCGIVPSQNETLWITRKDSGADDRGVIGQAGPRKDNGSLFINTNAGGTIKETNAWIDSWGSSSGSSGCIAGPITAGSTPSAFSGTPCTDTKHAANSLIATASGANQTLANVSGTNCLIFQNSNNTVAPAWYAGEPVLFIGYDTTSTPLLMNDGTFWIVGTGLGGSSDGVSIATKPGGPCITETAANIVGGSGSGTASEAVLEQDLSFDNLFLQCNAGAGCVAANPTTGGGNPEQFMAHPGASAGSLSASAKAGWFSIAPDPATATADSVSLMGGTGGWFGAGISAGGRLRVAVDSVQSQLSLTSAVSLGPTPPVMTVTGGSLAGSSETLTFTAPSNGGAFQAPTGTGNPGQSIVVAGMTPSSWNCGTVAAPCIVTASTTTSVTLTNAGATGSFSVGGTVIPTNIVLEFAPGTFAYNSSTNPNGYCVNSSTLQPINTGSAQTCLGEYVNGTALTFLGTNSTAFPIELATSTTVGFATRLVQNSNCLPMASGQVDPGGDITYLATYVPAGVGGTTNDIATLQWTGTAIGETYSFNAFNSCGTGPFWFGDPLYDVAGLSTTVGSDIWADSQSVLGPTIFVGGPSGGSGPYSTGAKGAAYVTNAYRYDNAWAADVTSYAWGVRSLYNGGQCDDQTLTLVDIQCTSGLNAVPLSFGGYPTVNPTPITDAWDSSTVFNSSTESKCSGQPCIHAATLTLGVGTGTLPFSLTQGWEAIPVCNFASPILSATSNYLAISLFSTFNNATNPATITWSSPITSSTCIIATQNPVLVLYSTSHIDMDFWSYNSDTIGGLYVPWAHWNDIVQENANCTLCGTMQGIYTQGANLWNVAFDDGHIGIGQLPVPSQLSIFAVALSGVYTNQNVLIRNTDIWGNLSLGGSRATLQDVYMMNDGGGPNIYFPFLVGLDPYHTGFYAGYGDLAGGEVQTGSNGTNVGVWPSPGQAVNSSGVMTGVGTPWSGSLVSCPWKCIAGDSGLGTF